MKLDGLEKKIGYTFKNRELLNKSLTHSSYCNEHRLGPRQDNEALEFLGDSIVGMLAAKYFFNEFPGLSEGELSKLKSAATNTEALAVSAKDIGLDKFIMLGKGELKNGGRKKHSILADSFEALMAGIFLDGGFEPVEALLFKLFSDKTGKIRKHTFEINNYKSALQEHFLKEGGEPPCYRIIMEQGPPHKRKFTIEVLAAGRPLARAAGYSKKSAEQQAAAKAFKKLTGRRTMKLSKEDFVFKR